MKQREINERPEWTFWLPDSIADWDAPSHWERERLASMQELLHPGDVLVDVGAEHGWLTAVYGSFVGYENCVLVEPSPEFWPNIRGIWERNGFPDPYGCYQAFCGAAVAGDAPHPMPWPECSIGEQVQGMAYRYLHHGHHISQNIPTVTINRIQDDLARPIDAINVDVEGAEFLVMQGAEKVLRDVRPIVWISIHPDLMARDYAVHPKHVIKLMEDHGYTAERIAVDHEQHWLFLP